MPPINVSLRQQVHGSIPQTIWSLYQIMSWLRSQPAFFVRCAESIVSPCCGEKLVVIGSRLRKVVSGEGETKLLVIRRLRCSHCRKIHHELPDCIVPYKRYESECIEHVVAQSSELMVAPADHATLQRWRLWFQQSVGYWEGVLRALAVRYNLDPVRESSVPPQSAHLRLGRLLGDAPGLLARVVRPIANANLWLHTRSAFLSAPALR